MGGGHDQGRREKKIEKGKIALTVKTEDQRILLGSERKGGKIDFVGDFDTISTTGGDLEVGRRWGKKKCSNGREIQK